MFTVSSVVHFQNVVLAPPNRDCDSLFQFGEKIDGVYTINIRGNNLEVFCSFEMVGYNWIVSLPCLLLALTRDAKLGGRGRLTPNNLKFWLTEI